MKAKKVKCDCKSQPDYHRDDCLYYDSYGNKKSYYCNPVVINTHPWKSQINEEQAKSRVLRKGQENVAPKVIFIDYFHKISNIVLDEEEIKKLKQLQNDLRELSKNLKINIHL